MSKQCGTQCGSCVSKMTLLENKLTDAINIIEYFQELMEKLPVETRDDVINKQAIEEAIEDLLK